MTPVISFHPRIARRALCGAVLAFGLFVGTGAGPAVASPLDFGSVDLGRILPNLFPDTTETPGRIGCDHVIQIGDSTSVGVDSPTRVPAASDRLSAQYASVGARTTTLDAVGGRSIVERVGAAPNADDAVAALLARGERGCWVVAMGVNDAANVAVGSTVTADQRIDRIMTKLAGQPVLWPTVTTSNPTNAAYRSAAMRTFDDALRRATNRYRNLAVYDWAAQATPSMFVDGIHYTPAGSATRNRYFAKALTVAYPARGQAIPSKNWFTV